MNYFTREHFFTTANILLTMVFLGVSAFAQSQVANFSTGKPGAKSYEHFSFNVEDGTRSEVTYNYGKAGTAGREIKLDYLGRDTLDGVAVFKVGFPNNRVLYIIPQKTYLKVVDEKGNYSKIFRWEYVGPVNGIGTWCDSCTQDEKESSAFVRRYFLK